MACTFIKAGKSALCVTKFVIVDGTRMDRENSILKLADENYL